MICVPRNVNESVMVMCSPETCVWVLGRGLRIKSMSSCVLDVSRQRLLSRHQLATWATCSRYRVFSVVSYESNHGCGICIFKRRLSCDVMWNGLCRGRDGVRRSNPRVRAEGRRLTWKAVHLNPLLPSAQKAPDAVAYAGVNIHAQQFIKRSTWFIVLKAKLKLMNRMRGQVLGD